MSHTQHDDEQQMDCSTSLLDAAELSSHVDNEEHCDEYAEPDSGLPFETDDELSEDIDPEEFSSIPGTKKDLRPLIDALVKDESSCPFRTPRKDGKVEGRYGIIKPICFEEIYVKLAAGHYADLAKFRDDMGRLFGNARIFFSEKSVQYQQSLKLHDLFVELATPLFRRHGYCCADTYFLPTQLIVCAKCKSSVERGNWWHRLRDARPDTTVGLCHLCYDQGTMLPTIVFPDGTEVPRADFERLCHNELRTEPLLPCTACNREFHAACVGFIGIDSTVKFVCDHCGGTPLTPTARANAIPHTQMSRFIEEQVNDFLQNQTTTGQTETPGRVFVRVTSAQKASIRRGDSMEQIYGECEFPYVQRAVYAFQETSDGQEVCFFAFHAQEYGDDCPPPNRGHVYLAYLDSIKFFRPVAMRTEVYHQILFAYMDWMRQRGFVRLNLWSLPPHLSKRSGVSYLFPSRAAGHKVMTRNMLLTWYDKLFASALEKGIIKTKTTALEAYASSIRTAADVPYFGGDILSERLDKAAEDEQKAARASRKRCEADASADAVVKRFLTGHKRLHQEHLVVDLIATKSIMVMPNGVTTSVQPDSDPLFSCRVIANPQVFFRRCAKLSLSFSTLRQAKFATKHLIHWINTDRKPSNSH
ncbi:TAZ zinc finger family protein [Aphelenchoides avenae]|nr:TAZ zinc finger family protein [Aphelenchus avenae]